ncbi:unnamed protein product [Ixodes pacificus]
MPKDVDHVGAAGERPECHRAALASSGLAFCPSAGTAQPRRKGPHSLHVRGTSAVVDRVLAAPNERNKIPKKPPGHPNARAPVTPAAVWLTRLPPPFCQRDDSAPVLAAASSTGPIWTTGFPRRHSGPEPSTPNLQRAPQSICLIFFF